MGKKGKGRQSSGFASKSLRANQSQEVERIRDETLRWTRRETSEFVAWTSRRQQERLQNRPRFVLSLRRNLTGILNERRSRDAYLFRERRRRNGFLPSEVANSASAAAGFESAVAKGLVHSSGWLIRYQTKNRGGRHSGTDSDSDSAASGDDSRPVEKLQNLALVVFANYIRDYRDAMGDGELYGALSMLPPESRSELSILLSLGIRIAKDSDASGDDGNGNSNANANSNPQSGKKTARERTDANDRPQPLYMDNDMAMLLGQHSDVECLCLANRKKASGRNTLTRAGLEALIPQTPSLLPWTQRRRGSVSNNDDDHDDDDNSSSSSNESVLDCWDDEDDENNNDDDNHALCCYQGNGFRIGGGNLKLRRLELLDLNGERDDCGEAGDGGSMAGVLVRWFEKCSGITHLSLAGCFAMHHEVGIAVVLSLPSMLPVLEVLDVTRCPWATDSLMARVANGYHRNPVSLEVPTIYYYRGVFAWEPLERNGTRSKHDPWEDNDGGEDR